MNGGIGMNKNAIRTAKSNYNRMMNIKNELTLVKNELLKMQHDASCKESLKVIEQEEAKIPSEEEILKYSFYNVEQKENEGNFYVYIGAYCCDKNGNYPVKDYRKADYFVYQNLDQMFSGKVVYPQEQEEFEKDHIVFKFSENKDIREKFLQLQMICFRQYLANEDISETELLVELVKHL